MAKKIENKDLFAADFLEPQKKSVRELIELIKMMESEMKDILKVNQQLLKQSGTSNLKDLENRKKAITNINQVSKELEKIEKQRLQTEAKLKVAESDQAKALERTRQELNKKKKAVRDEIKAEKELTNGYAAQSRRLNELRKQYKDLILVQGKETRESRKLRKEITALDTKLKRVDAATGQFQRNVGNYPKVLGGAINALRSFGLALSGVMIIRNVFKTVKDFGQAQADLAAISGKTKEELEPLTAQAKELGATTQFSATQITELQVELAKLGFTAQQIQDSTGAVSNFAAATGADLASAAALAGSALRAFNLDASEMDRVVSTLGVATTKSALDFGKLEAGLSTVAPVAAAFGFSIEDTTALLGQLSNAGFDASSAATATRNILLNLADANGDLAKELGRPIKSADDLAAGLQELESRGINLAEALELTDKRSVAAFQTFIQGADDLVGLRDSITDVNKELEDMAEKRLDSLQGSITLLSSAWEGFILGLEDGTGAFGSLKDAIRFVAENLQTIMKIIAVAITSWGSYRIALALVNSETLKFIGLKFYGAITSIIKGLAGLTTGANAAAFSLRGIGTAIKSIPIVGWVAGLATAITTLNLFGSEAEIAAERAERLNQALEKGAEIAEETNSKINKSVSDRLVKEEIAFRKSIENGTERRKALERTSRSIRLFAKQEIADLDELITQRTNEAKAAQEGGDDMKETYHQLTAELEKLTQQRIELVDLEVNANAKATEFFLNIAKERTKAEQETEKEKKKREAEEEKRRREAERRAKEIQALRRRLEDLNADAIKDEEERRIKQTQLQFDREIADLTKHGKLTKEVSAALERKKQREILKIQKEFIEKRLKAEIDLIKHINELQITGSEIEAEKQRSTEINIKRIAELQQKIDAITYDKDGIDDLETQNEKIQEQIDLIEKLKQETIGAGAGIGIDNEEELNALYDKQNEILTQLNQKQLVRIDYQQELNHLTFANLSPLQTERDLLRRNADIRLNTIDDLKQKLKEQIALGIDEEEAQEQLNKLKYEELQIQQKIRDINFQEQQEKFLKKQLDLQSEFNEKLLSGEFEQSEEFNKLQEKLYAEKNRLGGADEKRVKKLEKKLSKIKKQSQEETNARILEAEKELQREILKSQIRAKTEERNLYDESSKEYKERNVEIQDLEKQLLELNKTTNDEIAENERQKLRERYDAFKAFVTKIVELMDAKTDKQIANIDKELEASKNRQSQLEELANRGNLKAEQSVSAEIKRQAELERQREALEKKKLRRRAFLEGLELLGNKIETGEKDAVTATIRDMTTLLSALASLPGFYEGTNTTIEDALGKPNLNTKKDGYLVRVDGKEKVLNPSMSARTGNMTTEEITKAAEMYRSGALDYGMLIHPQVQNLNAPYQSNEDILRKFDELSKTIKDKPILSDLKFDELSKALVVTIESNGDLKRTHYKLK